MFRLVVLLACLGCVSAHAQDARLSDRGRWLVAGALGGSVSNNDGHSRTLTALPPAWDVYAKPSALYFLRDRVAIGGYVGYGYTDDPSQLYRISAHELSLGVQAGFELALAPRLGWMFFPSFGYTWRHLTIADNRRVDSRPDDWRQQQPSRLPRPERGHYDLLEASLLAPLVFHVSDTLGFGFGPELALDVYLNQRDPVTDNRYVRVRLGFGSWIGASF